ncbi:MAG: hypothetical protein IPK31_16580 [Chitinophagaceae bacterium]|nr:hypothetical protein [Chitinophagaceae bacterium]
MRKYFINVISLFFPCIICLHYQSVAQSSQADTFFYKKAIENTVLLYHKQMGNQRGVFNGVSYYGYTFPFEEGHPYFSSGNPEQGSIVYDSIFYPDVLLSYDEVAGVVVLHQSNLLIQLLSNRISRFEILAHNFIHITEDELVQPAIKPGFYELLYEGKSALIKRKQKRSKTFSELKEKGF